MASEQVSSRKKQSRSVPKEELRHPVLYRHQDCIPNPKLLQSCERNVLLGLKNNQSQNNIRSKVVGQETNESKSNSKKCNHVKSKNDDKTDKAGQETKVNLSQPNGTLGNNEELSKSRRRRLRKRRLLVALAPTLTKSNLSPPPTVVNNQGVKVIPRPVAQSSLSTDVPPNPTAPSRSELGKPSVKESRKRSEKSISSRSKSLKSKSLAETTHHTKADIIKTLEEKTLNSLLQTLVPLTNSSPKKEKPSLPLFSFPEKRFTTSESKVDKDGVFYFGETKHQLEKLSSSFSNYSTSPFSDKFDAAQSKELNRNCFSASKISSLENIVPSFNFSQTASARPNCSTAIRQNLFNSETVAPNKRLVGNNIYPFPSAYTKDSFPSPVLKDLYQFRSECFTSPSATPTSPSNYVNRPNNIPTNTAEVLNSATNLIKPLHNTPVTVSGPKTQVASQKLFDFPQSLVPNTAVGKSPVGIEISNPETNIKPAVTMKPTEDIKKSNKSREEILLEREAKKAAKLAAKAKKSTTEKGSVPITDAKTETESINQNSIKNKVASVPQPVNLEKGPSKDTSTTGNNDVPVMLIKDLEVDSKKQGPPKTASSEDAPVKSKAELKAERRAKQEAQRAAKAAGKTPQSQPQEKVPKAKTEQSKPVVSTPVVQTEKKIEVLKTLTQPKPKLFSHLYREKTNISTEKLLKVSSLHPAVVRLGVQYATRVVVGSNARCVALLRALIQMVNDYTTPSEKDFSRGLEEELGPVVRYLDQCRPLAVSMTNALRHLSRTLTQLPNSMTDAEAKRKICDVLETYIHEQINMAGKSICETVQKKIVNGDVILIFGCSSLLYQILVESHASGVKFRVVVVDGLPWLEGREMLRRLVEKGLSCTYVLITAASFIMREATKVLLGAHALLANGYVISRAGSSQVALLAHCCNVPVLVCCENHKFCERAQTDAFVYNEIGELHCSKMKEKGKTLTNLTPLSLAYDITPPDLVTAVVTELAVLPCTSVPVILRIRPSELAM
ncbi:uncharacterized protein LOC128988809 [Macrosteles quadrilineatus]|uniref:uncharacterized protein LOC128988809 n=1 Tax=Macrosteles quadrilineatus TaxID=74068 RepID=UPI0023E33048|nr:uncharacterized protein LOC128988809 [Macrosteles quadrilineatus]